MLAELMLNLNGIASFLGIMVSKDSLNISILFNYLHVFASSCLLNAQTKITKCKNICC